MNSIKLALRLDTFLQVSTILFILGALIACAINNVYIGLAWKAFFAVGAIQTLSAIGMGIALHDSRRSRHLGFTLAYFIGLLLILVILRPFASSEYAGTISTAIGSSYIFGIPAILAIRYFSMTVRDMIRVNKMRRSFWDL